MSNPLGLGLGAGKGRLDRAAQRGSFLPRRRWCWWPKQNYAVARVPLTALGDHWASGKLLEDASDSCAGGTQGLLSSPQWQFLVPLGWNRAYSGSGAASCGYWPAGVLVREPSKKQLRWPAVLSRGLGELARGVAGWWVSVFLPGDRRREPPVPGRLRPAGWARSPLQI